MTNPWDFPKKTKNILAQHLSQSPNSWAYLEPGGRTWTGPSQLATKSADSDRDFAMMVRQRYWSKSLLVGGFNPCEKYVSLTWDDYSRYMGKNMFQTTNQFGNDWDLRFQPGLFPSTCPSWSNGATLRLSPIVFETRLVTICTIEI